MNRFLLVCFLIIISCSPTPPAPNKFSDPQLVKIYEMKDRRQSDSLLVFLKSSNVVYRREAALAFGSVQDSSVASALGSVLLEDPDTLVRRDIAFALGQTGGIAAVNALIPALENKDRIMLREVLEALGKTLQENDVAVLSRLESNDTLLQEGLVWGFYHLGVRRKADSTITRKAASYLANKYNQKVRLAAASYFARSQKIEGEGFEEKLIVAAQNDKSPFVRMAAVRGFRHLEASEAVYILNEIVKSDPDYRVRVNAVVASQNFPLKDTQDILFSGLHDSVDMVKVAASEVIRNVSGKEKLKRISEDAPMAANTRVKANLYGALLKSGPPDNTIDQMINLYKKGDTYFKSGLLSAMGEAMPPHDEKAVEFISGELMNDTNEKVIKTSAAAALVAINENPETEIPSSKFFEIYKKVISENKDFAVTGVLAGVFVNESLKYKEQVHDLDFLHEAKSKLTLPKDIESLQPLENAIAYLSGKEKPAPLKNEFNHPQDWELIKTIPVGQTVEIQTNKGTIVLRMLINEAPGSVANFISLVKRKYFDDRFFHRVVPNFVIQTGCNRGDGYGSEDYSIRSEFSLRRYKTGSVGMASAGKDTEGTQWFITHSPTPHLDGRFTIFAEVISGMDIVHSIDVGDRIMEARIVKEGLKK